MTVSVRPKDREKSNWFDVLFVRIRTGFRDHLRYFSTQDGAMIVFIWALLNRDHETGDFVADRGAIMQATGLSDWKVKKALAWLRHGRRCECKACESFTPHDWTVRPSYIEMIRPPFRATPPIYRIRKDDSKFIAAARRHRKKSKQSKGSQTELF